MTIPAKEEEHGKDVSENTADAVLAETMQAAEIQQEEPEKREPDIDIEVGSDNVNGADTYTDGDSDTARNKEDTKRRADVEQEKSTSRLPKACYCPITGKILRDPAVHPNGESYERSAIKEQESEVICYPNRALKTYIEKELERTKTSNSGAPDGSLKSGWESLLQTVALPFSEMNPLPDSFYCPITFDLIYEPVITKDGYTFEQAALINWIKVSSGDITLLL
jgi:hypothetical protein